MRVMFAAALIALLVVCGTSLLSTYQNIAVLAG